ncbi:MAG: choline/carnitine O-acyltransferase [Anaerolineae bacterium]|nr:choline/carnitine O-acyltransferase [Anaerolineae bacterium]
MADVSKDNPNEEAAREELKRMSQSAAQQMGNSAHSLANLSHLSRLEIDQMVQDVSELIPAGNIPTMILNGLARLQNQASPAPENTKRDIRMIFRGMGQMLDEASYRLLVHIPARAILAYQKILKLAGKNPEDAFPRGTWQFYVDYAMREDTARHTNESDGFDNALREHNIVLSDVDRITAWVMTAIYTLHHYDDLLKNEWRERIYTRKLATLRDDAAHQQQFGAVWRKWLAIRPYRRMADARGDEFYPEYRSKRFDSFLFDYINQLDSQHKRQWMVQIQAAKSELLADYQDQMSILGYLEPDANAENHAKHHIMEAQIAVVYDGRYYLIPVSETNRPTPLDVETVRAKIKAMIETPARLPQTDLRHFATVKRWEWSNLRKRLPKEFVQDLDSLRHAPIILNFDPRNRQATLSEIRQAERGVGDHALTIFDTRSSFCFDQSHIYFDGAWGAALTEIMTNQALSWANYLHQTPEPRAAKQPPIHLPFIVNQQVSKAAAKVSHAMPETAAENDTISLKRILQLRKYFKMRSDLLDMTVNDLMVLYRAIHGITYQPHPDLVSALLELRSKDYTREAAEASLDAIQKPERSASILIPVDASLSSPRERLYPMSFEVPLEELHLLDLHQDVINALDDLEAGGNKRRFNQLQGEYLAALAGFGKVMAAAKAIALAGESGSIKSIKMLAHIPTPLQRLLDAIPGRWDVLNDIIKGREVFSNVGRVAKMSTLRRFITAKDDNEKKTLAWGVITDADGVVRISLRDFRPHVALLLKASQPQLAHHITQDYLDSYVEGFNQYIKDLLRITRKSPETSLNMRPVD